MLLFIQIKNNKRMEKFIKIRQKISNVNFFESSLKNVEELNDFLLLFCNQCIDEMNMFLSFFKSSI